MKKKSAFFQEYLRKLRYNRLGKTCIRMRACIRMGATRCSLGCCWILLSRSLVALFSALNPKNMPCHLLVELVRAFQGITKENSKDIRKSITLPLKSTRNFASIDPFVVLNVQYSWLQIGLIVQDLYLFLDKIKIGIKFVEIRVTEVVRTHVGLRRKVWNRTKILRRSVR